MSARYVVKNSDGLYADGGRRWVKDQSEAMKFYDHHGPVGYVIAKDWARDHAASFDLYGPLRVVRLRRVPRRPRVTLRFRSESDRRYFLGQLSDGWGENFVDLDWPEGVALWDAYVVDVRPVREDE